MINACWYMGLCPLTGRWFEGCLNDGLVHFLNNVDYDEGD